MLRRLCKRQRATWNGGEFLLSIYGECLRLRRERSHDALRRMLSEEDLSNIGHSSKRFRRGFKLREAEKGG